LPRPALTVAVASTPPAAAGALRSEHPRRLADTAAAVIALPVPAVVHHERALPPEALARVLDAIEASTATATKKAYRSDWQRFATWAGRRRFPPLPTPPAVLAHYLTEAAAEQTGVGTWRYAPATLTRWVASINQVHTPAGLDAPGRSEVVRRALSGIRRIRATPPNRRAPLLLSDIRLLLTSLTAEAGDWPTGVAARTDAALLLMGFAGAHRRPELVALTLADVTLHSTDGLHVRLRRSKTDQEARGGVKALPYGRDPVTCPPCAYVRWRQILQAWDSTDPDGRRRAVMTVLRRQNASTTGLGGGEDGEDLGVQLVPEKWAVRISNNGEFIHQNQYTVADQGVVNVSHGCINLSAQSAQAYFASAIYGDPVEVTGTSVPLSADDGDVYDWALTWDQWKALAVT